MIRWSDVIETWAQLYDKFKVNREYKNKSWADEASYMKDQRELVEKITELDDKVKPEVVKIINEAFPEVEVVAFDSRMHSAEARRVGNVLLKGVTDRTQLIEIETWFERCTAYTIGTDRFEDLPEELKTKF